MRVANHDKFCLSLPEGHRFPMLKYDLLPKQLLLEGIVSHDDFFEARPAFIKEISQAHSLEYISKLQALDLSKQESRAIGFPLTSELVEREFLIVGGTIDCVHHALNDGASFTIAGGTHHAHKGHGEGFCVFNDIAVAAFNAIHNHKVSKVLVLDLDVHQGNGTALLTKDRSDIFTFSMHGSRNYPHRKESSDLDIPLDDGVNDEFYLETLNKTLPKLLASERPELIFYQAGVDVLESDKLGRMSLSINGCAQRDSIVFETAYKHQIPIVTTMGGGYSEDIRKIVTAHVNTFKSAQKFYQ